MNWQLVSEVKPDPCFVVIGHSEEWKDPDYNPTGIRECFILDDGTWVSAGWNNVQDTYENGEYGDPTHWQPTPEPPEPKRRRAKGAGR